MRALTSDLPAGTAAGTRTADVLARVVLPVDGTALPLYADGAVPDTPTTAQVLGRRRLRVPAGARVSLATWFAAFPAGWWAACTDVREVRLDVVLTGPGRVELFASDAAGRVTALPGRTAPVADADGGWVWFDVVAGDGEVVLERALWPDRRTCTPRSGRGWPRSGRCGRRTSRGVRSRGRAPAGRCRRSPRRAVAAVR